MSEYENYGTVTERWPVAETACGRVRGETIDGVAVFRGIPYGGRADGERRFLAPFPAESWDGVRDCLLPGDRAVQGSGNLFEDAAGGGEGGAYYSGGDPERFFVRQQGESENCLCLNVLTPGFTGKRPVLFYIHGGGYGTGSGAIGFGCDGLAREQDVVFVSLNHRLNVFGYLYLGAFDQRYADSGNAGMLDIIQALSWVQRNIEAFGGDPGNVTIFGESGGGGKVSTLLAMPGAAGLFHKAIIESGALMPGDQNASAAAGTAERILNKLGVSTRELDKLASLPAAAIFEAQRGLLEPIPIVDGKNLLRGTFDEAPAISAHIPVIDGACRDEMTIFSKPECFGVTWDTLQGAVERLSSYSFIPSGDPSPEMAAELIRAYRQASPDFGPSDIFFRISSDAAFGVNTLRQIEDRVRRGCAPVYRYIFCRSTLIDGGKMRAFHTAELPLLMRIVRYGEDEGLSRALSAAWAGFARTGQPGTKELPWPPYTLENRETMLFDLESRAVNDPDGGERQVWRV